MYFLKRSMILTCLLGTTIAQTKLRIMPMGDSITEITCWRALVWDQLAAAGLTSSVQYVGSMTDNTQNCVAQTPNWDMHHEGHSGFLAINIANSNLVGWLAANPPDVVMFMLGTNDVAQGHDTTDILAAYTKMVQEMRAQNPKMKIIVDLVIPLPSSPSGIIALNAAIPAWVASQNTTASPIWIADCNTGFTASMLRDGVHPNAQGDALISSRLSPVLIEVIDIALGTTATPTGGAGPTSTSTPGTTLTTSTIAITSPSPASGTIPKYGQCGGQGWSGSGTCASGSTCKYSNPYYSQCL